MTNIKLIIAGDRNYTDFHRVSAEVDKYLSELGVSFSDVEEVCGMASGVDTLGKLWANDNGIPVTEFPALWSKYGRAAGPIRNKQMAEYGTHLIAFLKSSSKGTRNMIKIAREKGLNVKVINI